MELNKSDLMIIFQYIEERPSMFSSGLSSFDSYKLYFEGLFAGMGIFSNLNFNREISVWFQDKTAFKAPNMVWFEQFKICYEGKTDQEKIKILIETIKTFFEESSFFAEK